MATEVQTITKELAAAARRRKTAEATAEQWREKGYALIVAGYDAGIPKQVLAREAGLTRQTVYTILLKAGRG